MTRTITHRAAGDAPENHDDPAIAAVARWLEAFDAMLAFETPSCDWTDDPGAMALEAEAKRRYWTMARTSPESAAGLALTLQAFIYDHQATRPGRNFGDVASWGADAIWKDGRDLALLQTHGRAMPRQLCGRGIRSRDMSRLRTTARPPPVRALRMRTIPP